MIIGIISDIHEDIESLDRSFEILDNEKCESFVCLGDMVGFSVPYYNEYLNTRSAEKVLRLVKERCQFVVVGNHDLHAIRRVPRKSYGFLYPKDWYELDFQERSRISEDQIWLYEENELSAMLSKDDQKYIESLVEECIEDFEDSTILFSHHAYPDLVGVTKKSPENIEDAGWHLKHMGTRQCDISISGHAHFEGMRIFSYEKLIELPMGESCVLEEFPVWIYGPMVARGSKENGVMVFNTVSKEIKTISLSPK